MTSAPYLAGSLFFMILTAYLMTNFDRSYCPRVSEYLNITSNETEFRTSWTDYIWGTKCEGLPSWYKLIIYVPFIAMAIRSIIATS